jgi:predicted RND superfamily exporter protein
MIRSLIRKSFINPVMALLILGGTAGLFYLFHTEVDLTPQVSSSFFFSKDSKIYRDDAKIFKKFVVDPSIVLSLPSHDISAPPYLEFVKQLSEELKKVKGVSSVSSLTHGPPDLEAGMKNPMWTRFLDTGSGQNSLIVCFIDKEQVQPVVGRIKKVISKKEFRSQEIYLSGIPYIIEEIRQMLASDMKQFISAAVFVSSVVLFVIFLSFVVTIGAIVTALAAAALTLLIQHYMGVPVGILTANLGAIVYVLTTSHVVFMTSNWRQDKNANRKNRLASTVVTTLPASFWAAATTVFGFASLIFVEAKPLQQLGVGGTIGTLSAFVAAYTIFPLFLRFSLTGPRKNEDQRPRFFLPFPLFIGLPLAIALVGASCYLAWLGVKHVNTDPSLLTYFKETQGIYKGIRQVDRFGGSNPLNFVISDRDGEKLKNEVTYKKMMALHNDIESHPAVGSVLSLPLLMAETQTNWLARLLPWGTILSMLSRDQFGKIARGFVTEDYSQGLFMIRMKESGRKAERKKIVNQLMAKPRKHGLRLDIVGGSYFMQSELAQKIRLSMKQGIQALLVLFAGIICLLSLSLPITAYASLSIVAATLAFLGCLGIYRIPVDIISSPAINVTLGLAVDGMIHIILAARRLSEAKGFRTDGDGWVWAIKSQGQAVLISGLVIAAGFSVFALSNFPPSQRFGLEIVFGTLLAMIMTLFVLPHLSLLFRKRVQTKKPRTKVSLSSS